MITTIWLVDTAINLHSDSFVGVVCVCVCVCVCEIRTFNIFPLSNFQIYSMVLLALVTIHSRIHCIPNIYSSYNWRFVPLKYFSLPYSPFCWGMAVIIFGASLAVLQVLYKYYSHYKN